MVNGTVSVMNEFLTLNKAMEKNKKKQKIEQRNDRGLWEQMELDKSTLSVVFCEVHKTIRTKQIDVYGKVFAPK